MSKKHKHWTEEEIKKLTKMNKRNVTLKKMSNKLDRSEKAIRLKLRNLDIPLVNKTFRIYKSKKKRLGNIYHPNYERG